MRIEAYAGRSVVPGAADGELLHADVGLSFMGGVDSSTGRVIDTHHPLHGQSVDGKVLALPSGRGSCSGSASLFELLVNRHAPVALIFRADEPILTLGVILAAEVFGVSIPVVRLGPADFAQLRSASRVSVRDGMVTVTEATAPTAAPPAAPTPLPELDLTDFRLSVHDRQLLSGAFGEAARLAIRVVIRAAQLEGANDLIDIDRGHIDGCFYQGPASLRFAERLVELGGQVAVPTSMNSLCIDRRRWREPGRPRGARRTVRGPGRRVPAARGDPDLHLRPLPARRPAGPRPADRLGRIQRGRLRQCGDRRPDHEVPRLPGHPHRPDRPSPQCRGAHRRRAAGDRADRGRRAGRATRRRVLSDAGLPRRHDRQQRHPGTDGTGAQLPRPRTISARSARRSPPHRPRPCSTSSA